jgi:hypothetical protein
MIVPYVEEAVSFEPEGLMDLEVEADGLHIVVFFGFHIELSPTDTVVDGTDFLAGILPFDLIDLLLPFFS